jgi:hypothetical protein
MTLVFAAALALAAGKPVQNRPYVQSGPDGVVYARCVPDAATGSAGTTKVYKVGRDADELLDTYPWYAREGVTLGWSPTAGKVAVMARRAKAELSFHLGGKELASYTTDDLGKLGFEVVSERGPMGPAPRAVCRVVGCEQVPLTNDYHFVVQAGETQVRFDILTGRPRR